MAYVILLPVSTLRSTRRFWTGLYWETDPRKAEVYATRATAEANARVLADDAEVIARA